MMNKWEAIAASIVGIVVGALLLGISYLMSDASKAHAIHSIEHVRVCTESGLRGIDLQMCLGGNARGGY